MLRKGIPEAKISSSPALKRMALYPTISSEKRAQIILLDSLNLLGFTFCAITYGVALVLYCICTHSLRQRLRKSPRHRITIVTLSYTTFAIVCATALLGLLQYIIQTAYVPNRDFPLGPALYEGLVLSTQPPFVLLLVLLLSMDWLTMGVQVLSNTMAPLDSLEMLPIFCLYHRRPWLANLGIHRLAISSGVGLVAIVDQARTIDRGYNYSFFPTIAAFGIPPIMTIIVTTLMVYRIASIRKRYINLMGPSDLAQQYTSVISMLIESYAIDALWSLGTLVTYPFQSSPAIAIFLQSSINMKENWTCEDEPYRYPIDESPKDPWERCFNAVDKSDDELCKDLKDEITYLLVVASLFLAIVTSFTVESFSWLREDQAQDAAFLLGQLVTMMNDSTTVGSAQQLPQSTPAHHEVVVNQLWFLSMTLSLCAVVVGTLCLQWLSAFHRPDVRHVPHDDALALRQLRYEGLIGWGVPRVPAILLLTVQGALVLFAIGLLYLLWSVNKHVALPVAIVSGVSVLLLLLTSFMPLLQSVLGWLFPQSLVVSQCPYKSPISWVIHRTGVLLAVMLTFPVICLPRFTKLSEWHKDQVSLLTDYLWQRFDELWRKYREDYGPQSSKLRTSQSSITDKSEKYSHYLVRGLASAMETLVFQPSAVSIIHTCLQEFHGTRAEVETFESLFSKDFTKAEEDYSKRRKMKMSIRFASDV
ncbi:hypothetical protein NP233_g7998 [Leucocoprinus birnbaumii]|uniref:DUF6535 domain-containing protein n=1 Tax=Leucocoprinus birnbaumii TaxID=56174 RepID=A0AAD5VPS1_9AGAR|nr:hypothetical protein NP233_g7998 [Leucocoprinus birnbaumii]